MKKIISTLIIAIFCFANVANATTQNNKEEDINNVSITIGDWKINGKVNGKIYISDDCKKDKKGRTKLGDSDIVTYSNGKINIEINEKEIENWAAEVENWAVEVEKWADEVEEWADEVENNLGNCEIVVKEQNRQNRITGSGNIITKDISAIASYDAIKVSRGIHAVMNDEESDKITIHADDNVMPYVIVRKSGESLIITIDENIKSISNVNIKVLLPKHTALNELKVASGASISIKPTIKGRSLSVDASSAGEVNIAKAEVEFFDADASSAASISGTVKSDDCYADASSAADIDLNVLAVQCKSNASSGAKIELEGEVATFEGNASSAAKIIAKELAARNLADASASSGAKISVNPTKKLRARASSAGTVTYVPTDDLLKDINQSSGGRVKAQF